VQICLSVPNKEKILVVVLSAVPSSILIHAICTCYQLYSMVQNMIFMTMLSVVNIFKPWQLIKKIQDGVLEQGSGEKLCIVERKTNLMHNLFLVYLVNLYMFRTYLGPSSGGTAVCIQQLVLFTWQFISTFIHARNFLTSWICVNYSRRSYVLGLAGKLHFQKTVVSLCTTCLNTGDSKNIVDVVTRLWAEKSDEL